MNKVENHPNLRKGNGSVIDTDDDAYNKRKQAIRNAKRLDTIEQNQHKLNDKLDLILSLLQGSNTNDKWTHYQDDSQWNITIQRQM